jgi:hypothetical protein
MCFVSSPALATSTDVKKIVDYTAHVARLEDESQTMHGQMMHALFGYLSSKSNRQFNEFTSDFDQDDRILQRQSVVQSSHLSNANAESSMQQASRYDRAWATNARTELHQLLQIGKTLTVHQYLAETKHEDATGSSLSSRSTMLTFAALREEGLSAQQIEAVMLQDVAESGAQ